MTNTIAKILSMTGQAHLETTLFGKSYRMRLSSVNHRFFELHWRSPCSLQHLEFEANRFFKEKVQRGSLTFTCEELNVKDKEASSVSQLWKNLSIALNQSENSNLGFVPRSIKAMILSRFPDYWLKSSTDESLASWEEFRPAAEKICEEFLKSREQEGAGTSLQLAGILEKIDAVLKEIVAQLPDLKLDWEENLKGRITQLAESFGTQAPEEGKLLQEYLFLAEKRDIQEEIQRARLHLEGLKKLFSNPPAQIGKRLDFFSQELHREFTTMGNKIKNPMASQKIMDAKLLIENIKEQSMNLL